MIITKNGGVNMKVLVVIDMQNDFIDGALGSKEAVSIIEPVRKKIKTYRQAGLPVIFTRDTHEMHYLDTQEGKQLPVPHCIRGTKGWEIAPQFEVEDSIIINKPTFGSVELAQYIKEQYPDTELELELVGLCTDICVISNALVLKATIPEIKISVDASCCAGVTPQSHKNALEAMKVCQIIIANEEV
ncbi:MAG: Amidase related to nicotinamidase [Clostridiales bacterium]|nr:Amidase related to nicotinamidase [Clostridiales bacterium]